MNPSNTNDSSASNSAPQMEAGLASVEKNWNAFGKRDPLWAILTVDSKKNGRWEAEEFFATGRSEIENVVRYVRGLRPVRKGRAMDFGCGVGRLTQALAEHFEHCHGVDIAESMVAQARQYNRFGDRVEYHVNRANDLRLFVDNTFDFIYTNIVLQHNPQDISRRYLQEFTRVLAPGGVLLFQLPAERAVPTLGSGVRLEGDAFRAAISVDAAPREAKACSGITIKARVRNNSNVTWPAPVNAGSFLVRLGNHWRDSAGHMVVQDDGRTDLPRALAPGEEVALELHATVPSRPGVYRLELDMVQEAVAWFADRGSVQAVIELHVTGAEQETLPSADCSTPRVTLPAETEAADVLVPHMEMNGIPKDEVIALLTSCGAKVVDIRPDQSLPGWESYWYLIEKPAEPAAAKIAPSTNASPVVTAEAFEPVNLGLLESFRGKILIDGVIFQIQRERPAGISRVWITLLKEIANSPLADKVVLLDREASAPKIPGIKTIPGNSFLSASPEAEAIYLQHVVDTERVDLLISTYYTYPANSPCMIVLHDMTPEVMGFDLGHPEWSAKTKAIHKAFAYLSVSESTRRDFRKLYPQYATRPVHLVPNTLSTVFQAADSTAVSRFRQSNNLRRPYFLISGHRLGYKNVIQFFRAFALLENRADFDVICTGGNAELEKLFLPFVRDCRCEVRFFSDRELSLAYAGATAVIYPSLYEGFGLPVLEAMSSGAPVIAGRNSSIPEVGGDAVRYVDGYDVADMLQALRDVQDEATRRELITRGHENVKRFSVGKTRGALLEAMARTIVALPTAKQNPDDPISTSGHLIYALIGKNDAADLRKALAKTLDASAHELGGDWHKETDEEHAVQKVASDAFFELLSGIAKQRDCDHLIHYWHGLLLEKRQRDEQALAAYERACAEKLASPRIIWRAARVAMRLNRPVTAHSLLASLAKLKNPAPEVRALRERVDRELAQVAESLQLKQISSPANEVLTAPNVPTDVLVSIILPTKGRSEGLEAALASLPRAMSGLRYEILLYSSDLTDETVADLKLRYPIRKIFHDSEVLPKGSPFSWSTLMNHGFKHAAGDWICYASDDIEFHPGAFARAVAIAHAQPKIGGVTFLHRNTVQDFGGRFKDFGYDTVGRFAYINFGIVRRSAFQATKGFDERFKFYWADVDLCLQLWESGFEVAACEQALVEHNNISDASRKSNSGDRYFADTKNFRAKWDTHSMFGKASVLAKQRFSIEAERGEKLVAELGNSSVDSAHDAKLPLVTAIVSAYKSERFLRGCLEDLESQTIADQLEIIVVDSASPENERAIVEEFQKRFSNIVYIRSDERETVYGAWNRGLKAARGKFITNANTDDRHRRDALEVLARTLEDDPGVALVYGDCLVTRTENETFDKATIVNHFKWLDFNAADLLLKGCFVGPQPMWRREVHAEHGYFDAEMFSAGDYEFWLRLAQTQKFLHVKETLGLYLESPTSVEHTNAERNAREAWTARERHGAKIVPGFRQLPLAGKSVEPRQKKLKPAVAGVGSLDVAREKFRAKQLEEAWQLVTAAIEQRPFHPEAFLFLAEIAIAVHAPKAAKEAVAIAQRLAPDWKRARRLSIPHRGEDTAPSWMIVPALPTSPRLSVCLIARNEEKFLGACLKSVRDIASQIVLVDTGSSDRTIEIAKEHGAEVHHFPWCDDFSAARNAALEHAGGDWVLVLDADEEFPAESLAKLRADMKRAEVVAYRLPIVDAGREREGRHFIPRLFRNAPGLYFAGRIHEQVFPSIENFRGEFRLKNELGTATILHHGYSAEVTRSRGKNERNLRLLHLAIEESPEDANLLMNFGLEQVRAGDLTSGLVSYERAWRSLPQPVVPELRDTLLVQFCTQLLRAEQPARIIEILETPLGRTAAGNASLHFLHGVAATQMKRWDVAIAQFRACLAQRDKPALTVAHAEIFSVAPRHCLAVALANSSEVDAADGAFVDALREAPDASAVLLDYTNFLVHQQRAVDALQRLHEFAQRRPEDASVWVRGGELALEHPEFLEVALDWTATAHATHSNDERIMKLRAEALMLAGFAREALELWRQIPALNSRGAAAMLLCASIAGIGGLPDLKGAATEVLYWIKRFVQFGAEGSLRKLDTNLSILREHCPAAAERVESVFAGTEVGA